MIFTQAMPDLIDNTVFKTDKENQDDSRVNSFFPERNFLIYEKQDIQNQNKHADINQRSILFQRIALSGK